MTRSNLGLAPDVPLPVRKSRPWCSRDDHGVFTDVAPMSDCFLSLPKQFPHPCAQRNTPAENERKKNANAMAEVVVREVARQAQDPDCGISSWELGE